MSTFVERDEAVVGVTRVSSDRAMPRPHIGVVGAIHGDESCGLRVLERLMDQVTSGALAPLAGTWVLIHGNPDATSAGRRYTKGGVDLNRLFDFAFEEELPRARWVSEHERASSLKPVLSSLDALLDLHSASRPTPAFALINDVDASADIARRLGFDFVVHGWAAPGLMMDRVTVGVMQRLERPGLSVECGQHADPNAVEAGWACALRYLRACGVLEGTAEVGDPMFLRVSEIIMRPSEGFRFTRPIRGLDRLEAGETFAADRVAEMRVREPCYALLPNDAVPVGRDMVFLARPSGQGRTE